MKADASIWPVKLPFQPVLGISAANPEGAARLAVKYANASRDIANFVNNADLMDQRKKDYQMTAEFEGASGITKIQVGRNWSKTLVLGVIGILLVLVLLYVLTKLI